MLPDRVFSTFQTASQGLALQREKISTASRNIANAQTTSSPVSKEVYKPQSVQSTQPTGTSFKKVLVDSLSSLKTTHPNHISTAGSGALGSKNTGFNNLGPQFEVIEQENFRFEYDPNHPDADENGMVKYPDVDLIREMTQLVSANRLYEANLSSIEAEKEIIKRALEI